jgi:hypothetical protein
VILPVGVVSVIRGRAVITGESGDHGESGVIRGRAVITGRSGEL